MKIQVERARKVLWGHKSVWVPVSKLTHGDALWVEHQVEEGKTVRVRDHGNRQNLFNVLPPVSSPLTSAHERAERRQAEKAQRASEVANTLQILHSSAATMPTSILQPQSPGVPPQPAVPLDQLTMRRDEVVTSHPVSVLPRELPVLPEAPANTKRDLTPGQGGTSLPNGQGSAVRQSDKLAPDEPLDDEVQITENDIQQATDIVQHYGRSSIPLLQRRMKIGYSHAVRLIDELKVRGVISDQPSAQVPKPFRGPF